MKCLVALIYKHTHFRGVLTIVCTFSTLFIGLFVTRRHPSLKGLDLDLAAQKGKLENIKLLPVNIFRVLLRYIISKKKTKLVTISFLHSGNYIWNFLDVLKPLCNYTDTCLLSRLASCIPHKKVLWRHIRTSDTSRSRWPRARCDACEEKISWDAPTSKLAFVGQNGGKFTKNSPMGTPSKVFKKVLFE